MRSRDNGYVPEAQLQFVSDTVMAFAVALRVSNMSTIPVSLAVMKDGNVSKGNNSYRELYEMLP